MLWSGAFEFSKNNTTNRITDAYESCSFFELNQRVQQQEQILKEALASGGSHAYLISKHRFILPASPTLGFVSRLLACFRVGMLPCVVSRDATLNTEACLQWNALGYWNTDKLFLLRPPQYKSCIQNGFETPSEALLVLFTSGSSGQPKGVILGKKGLREHLKAVAQHLALQAPGTVLVTLPLHHAFALITQVLLTLYTGGDLHLLPSQMLPGEQLSYLYTHQIERMAGVPSQWRALLLQDPEPVGFVKHIQVAGASLDFETADKMQQAFPDADIWVGYGLSEAGPRVTAQKYSAKRQFAGAGLPLPGVELKIVDDIVYVKTPAVMLGYLDNKQATEKVLVQGWLNTGDCGTYSQQGLKIEGRKDSLFQSAGEKIAPLGIEHVLRQHEKVIDVAIWGEPDVLLGYKIVAGVVAEDSLTRRELRQYARQHLLVFQVPREWRRFERLPMTANGKLQRQQLAQWSFQSI